MKKHKKQADRYLKQLTQSEQKKQRSIRRLIKEDKFVLDL